MTTTYTWDVFSTLEGCRTLDGRTRELVLRPTPRTWE